MPGINKTESSKLEMKPRSLLELFLFLFRVVSAIEPSKYLLVATSINFSLQSQTSMQNLEGSRFLVRLATALPSYIGFLEVVSCIPVYIYSSKA
jgi:hypothetical protein